MLSVDYFCKNTHPRQVVFTNNLLNRSLIFIRKFNQVRRVDAQVEIVHSH